MQIKSLRSDLNDAALFSDLCRACPRFIEIARWAKHIGPGWSDEILARGSLAAPHPQTDEMINSVGFVSPTSNATFIEFEPTGSQPYCLIASRIHLGFEIGGIYLPQSNFLFRWDDHTFGVGVDAVERYDRLKEARTSGEIVPLSMGEGISLVVGNENFAHHIMNELPALWRIADAGLAPRIRNVFTQFESLGPINRMIPAFAGLPKRAVAAREMSDILARHNVLMVGGTRVSAELREGLRSYVERIVRELYPDDVEDFLSKTGIPVFLALRTHSRVVDNNADMLIRVCRKLRNRLGPLVPILDGFSLPHDQPVNRNYLPWYAEQGKLSLQQSEDLARKLVSEGFDVVCTANKDVLLALWMSMRTDYYFSNQGTQQHKAGWLSNARGVVHFPPDSDHSAAITWFQDIVQSTPKFSVLPPDFVRSFTEEGRRGAAGYLFHDIDRAADWVVAALLNETPA